jgi:hypothetical protein
MKTLTLFAVFAAALTFCLSGCNKNSTQPNAPNWTGIAHVVLNNDTLRILPNDSGSVRGYVFVEDGRGSPVLGAAVELSLSDSFGAIEYDHGVNSDSQGRVYFWFRTNNKVYHGRNIIRARVPLWSSEPMDEDTLWLMTLSSTDVDSLHLWVDRDTVRYNGYRWDYQVGVYAWAGRKTGEGYEGVTLSLHSLDGSLRTFYPTDSTGTATVAWDPPHISGRYWFTIGTGALRDTAWVAVCYADSL